MAGLGKQFFNSFLDTTGYISQVLDGWRWIETNTRKINIKRFP